MIDDIDRGIIVATQAGLPIVAEPYLAVAQELNLDRGEVMSRIGRMLRSGVIRRIGAVPNHYALGLTANGMSVWDVEDRAAKELGQKVGELEFVSHCYLRPRRPPLWPYNLFAMVHGSDREAVEKKADEIGRMLGKFCRARDVLYSTRILKKTGLRIAA